VAKKAEQLNADLVKAEIYSKLDQKAVTTWLDLRNKAAHGKYDEYEARQVEIMNQGVIEFISRVAP
jgi:flagellar biosynthesis chaperone FliJ